ncbi:MAG: 16S rRNA (cytosine(967)-C(5))-methyltransferase RsmB [Clostridia bacterium]|nr:16S rRNA (cytosine(967)-C(5))-methyltransferase RsmB [Clostridia bacterium]
MPRELALSILREITDNDAFADLAVKNGLAASKLMPRDKALATALVYGTVQHLRFIDFQLESVSARPLGSLTPDIRNILRLAVYQIRFMDRVPDRAAVDEAVKMAKRHAYSASSFVNGVLRNLLRKGWSYPKKLRARLGVTYSFPDWLVKLWIEQFGAAACEKLLEACNEVPPLSVRVNPLKASKESVLCLCKGEEAQIENGLYIEEPSNIAETPMFYDGWISIQDIGAQMASLALHPRPGEAVLDVCAAPGGKTTHMAELMENEGSVTAWDIHPHRVELIRKNAARLGLSNVVPQVHDARILDPDHMWKYDKVMVDVPCSGLGIIRKKPDIKWRRIPEDLESLTVEQASVLETASYYVKRGGELLYCTCTLNKQENEDIVNAFLGLHSEYEKAAEFRTLLPHVDKTDGFFIAKLRKRWN